jgi:hypothetical protein
MRQIVVALSEGRMRVMDEPHYLPGPGGRGRFWMPTFFERAEDEAPKMPEGSNTPARIARAISRMDDPSGATYTITDLPDGEE